MDPSVSSLLISLGLMLPLMFLGVHLGVALGLGGIVGTYVYLGLWGPGINMLRLQSIDVSSNYTLMVIPLFVVLGSLASTSKITTDLFTMFYRWFGWIRGGVAISTIGTCAGMASITGSSVATAAAMTRIALPELLRFGYDKRLAAGAIATGGTLSIMIPPSITLVLYAIFAEQSVGKMLVAGIVPGLLLTAGYSIYIYFLCIFRSNAGPRGPHFTWRERLNSLPGVIPFLLIISSVIIGILAGIWTPVESAAVAVILVVVMGFVRRRLNLTTVLSAFLEAVATSASVFIIVIGSMVFSNFIALTGFSSMIAKEIVALNLPPFQLYLVLVTIFIILGMFMEVTSLMALTIPLLMPMVAAVGWDPIWFGVIVVALMEVAMVTPPVGLNLYAVSAQTRELDIHTIYMGALPFWLVNILLVGVLYFLPGIVLFLPNMMVK